MICSSALNRYANPTVCCPRDRLAFPAAQGNVNRRTPFHLSGLPSEINWSEMVIAGGHLRPVLPLGSRRDPLFRNGTNNPSIKLHRFLDLMWECTWDRSGSKTAIASVNSFRSIAERKSSFHEPELRVVKTGLLAGQLHQIGTNPREAA